MWPKGRRDSRQQGLFRIRPALTVDREYRLMTLADVIGWGAW